MKKVFAIIGIVAASAVVAAGIITAVCVCEKKRRKKYVTICE